jgi:hypothetical protein
MARDFDVFNGDADGLCALQQLRLAQPRQAVLVTGTKRDIALLQRVPAGDGDRVTVLDISLARNHAALEALLARGAAVDYFDHHHSGLVPRHPLLRAHLDPAPEVCTSVLVDRHLAGAHRAWAVVGAYGDGLPATAQQLADALDLAPAQCGVLRALGEAVNYNAYGETEAELFVPPAQLAVALRPHADPLAFAATPLAQELMQRQQADLALAFALGPAHASDHARVFVLPDAPWARRVQGSFAHALGDRDPAHAHAVLCPRSGELLSVSVRAPRSRPRGADALCLAFATGGGRAAAAGIDALPSADVPRFLRALDLAFART